MTDWLTDWLDSGDGGDGSDSGDDDDAKYAKRLAHLMKTDPEFARTRSSAYQAEVDAYFKECDRANPVTAERAANFAAAEAARHASLLALIDAMNTPEKIQERRRAAIEHQLAHDAFWADHHTLTLLASPASTETPAGSSGGRRA
jgi:hypothetical protein